MGGKGIAQCGRHYLPLFHLPHFLFTNICYRRAPGAGSFIPARARRARSRSW